MNILFQLKDLELKRIDNKKIPAFNRNHIHVTFDFDTEWAELCKYALFVAPNDKKYVVYLGYGKERSCLVPNDVLTNAFFSVSVFADDLLISTQEKVLLYPSGYSLDIDDLDLEESQNVFISNDDDIQYHRNDEDYLFIQPGKEFERKEHPYD